MCTFDDFKCYKLIIDHLIPSINIFSLDLIYGFGDAIREYDYLVFAKISHNGCWEKLLFLLEETRSQNIDRELPKIIRDLCLNQCTIVRIHNDKHLHHYTPLCISLLKSTVGELNSSTIHNLVKSYLKIYRVGYELYLLLYYIALYVQPEVLGKDYNKYLKLPLPEVLNNNIRNCKSYNYYIKYHYIKCYNEHVEAINNYRLGVKNNYSLDDLMKCVKTLSMEVKKHTNKSLIEERIIYCLGKSIRKIALLTLPQIHMVRSLGVKGLEEKPKNPISKRVEYQNRVLKAISHLLKGLCKELKIYIVAFNWRNRLNIYFDEYIKRLRDGIENQISLCEGKDYLEEVRREVDENTGLVILILSDYRKSIIREILSYRWKTKRKLLILVPETCYVPTEPRHGSGISGRAVEALNVYGMLGRVKQFSDKRLLRLSYRVYVKCLS